MKVSGSLVSGEDFRPRIGSIVRVSKATKMSRAETPSSPVVCDIADLVQAAVSLGLDVGDPLSR